MGQIVVLERALSQTRRSHPTYPRTAWRLASVYHDLVRIEVRELRSDRSMNPRTLVLAQKAHERAVTLLDDYANYTPAQPHLDLALLDLGEELESLPALDPTDRKDVARAKSERLRARVTYDDLANNYAASPLVARAYCRLGDSYADDAAADLGAGVLADQAYERAATVAASKFQWSLATYARYRRGFALWRRGQVVAAKKELGDAIALAQAHPDATSPAIEADARAAISEM
jgi:hypothetical protein